MKQLFPKKGVQYRRGERQTVAARGEGGFPRATSAATKKQYLQCLILIALGFILPALAMAGAVPPPSPAVEFRQLERDIPSLYLINGLFLSTNQARQLAELQTGARRINDKAIQDMDRFLKDHQADLDRLLENKFSERGDYGKGRGNMGGDRRQGKQLLNVRREWQELSGRREKAIREVAEKTVALLTPAQRDIVDRFVPCFIPPGDFRNPERVGQAENNTSLGEKILARLREAPASRVEQGCEKALDLLVPYVMKERHKTLTQEEMQALRDDLGRSLDAMAQKIRVMSDADFELGKAELVKEVLCLEEQRGSRNQAKATKMTERYLLNPGVIDILCQRAGSPAGSKPAASKTALDGASLHEHGQSFRAARLMADLQVTPAQAKQLLPIVQAAVVDRKKMDDQADRERQEALAPYRALKTELANQQPTPKAEAAANRYHQQVKRLYEDNLVKAFHQYESQMDQVFSAVQVNYLVGKQEGKKAEWGAEKIGKETIRNLRRQAADLLDTAEKMNGIEFDKKKHDLCAQFVEAFRNQAGSNREEIDVAAETARAVAVLEQARKMGRNEYRRAKENLAAELCPRRRTPRPTTFGWKVVAGDSLEVLNPTTHVLFSAASLKLLQKRAVDSANGK
ncbi:MAG: hypothetical protein L6437_07470 [Kiritimatiellae bacterium]|nr:hypothetical protein [Verrucomicrobiota bacterium]MBU4286266.1 hypothetical protein [Verrucomicrobiota bacterium]MBU4365931.1 hypothetical protein [Verrucomicrobiota bacterium]MCG2660068.1 hypothetical protein [Kiritimatiellia bacterium]